MPLIFWGDSASKAQQGQPSPSGTAPAIQLLNPSRYSTFTYEDAAATTVQGPEMSDKDTSDADSALEYHFAAVVSNPPPQPYVEFFLVQGNQTFNLGCASATTPSGGCSGIFKNNLGAVELVRDIPDVFTEGNLAATDTTGGSATVRAILYSNSGQNEVARDDQAVVLNQKDRSGSDSLGRGDADPAKTSETVEILYPVHGGAFGFFRPGGTGAGIGVVDVEWSSDTDAVRVAYTVSPPDVDPEWKPCSTNETTGAATSSARSAQDGVRCTLVDGDQPEAVTGVAAVAMDNESSTPPDAGTELRDDSGDAHRVIGYSQSPELVSVTGQTLPADRVPGCSDLLTAQVFDASARPIAGVDVDVHAQGPTDNLAFNTHADEQSSFNQTNPDRSQAPQNHPTESGRRCSNGDPSGTQGVHAVGGGDDRKHIESVDDSDDDGQFVFRLWSDAEGGTRITAWADTTDDDRFCSNERAGDAIVTWGSAANDPAPPPDSPEPQPCPSPSPSGTGSPSGSASPTQSATQSPSQSPTGSPTGSPSATASASASPTGTVSPSPSDTTASPTGTATTSSPTETATSTTEPTTSPPGQTATETSLETSRPRKTFGRSFTLTGAVGSENAACTSFVDVQILRDVVGGNDDFELVEVVQTDQNGAFALTHRADISASYVAQVQETAACDDSTSTAVPVLVRVKVSMKLSAERIRRGQKVRIRLRTAPCPETARDKVLLFRAVEGKYGKTGKKRSDGSCRAKFVRRPRRHAVFQARWPKQMEEFLAGRTRPKVVRVRPRRG